MPRFHYAADADTPAYCFRILFLFCFLLLSAFALLRHFHAIDTCRRFDRRR
jgi:hypothetical protein